MRNGQVISLSGATAWTALTTESFSDFQPGDILLFGLPASTTPFNAYKIVSLCGDGVAKRVAGQGSVAKLSSHRALLAAYPNPFNPTTTISYEIPKGTQVRLSVFDVLGREIQTLVNETKQPGHYQVHFNANNLASGVYLYRIQAGSFTDTKRFVLVK
jgi:hypothetical protein